MAISYVGGSGVNTSSASSHTHSHTCGSGTNRKLVVSFNVATGSGITCTGVTYAGVAMTEVASKNMTYHGGRKQYIFVLYAPATGANNVVVTLSGSAVLGMGVNDFAGAAQDNTANATGQNATSGSSSSSVSVTTGADNCMLVGQEKDDSGGAAAGANTAAGGSGGSGGGDRTWYTPTVQTPAGSKTMNYSCGGAIQCDSLAIALAPYTVPSVTETNMNRTPIRGVMRGTMRP